MDFGYFTLNKNTRFAKSDIVSNYEAIGIRLALKFLTSSDNLRGFFARSDKYGFLGLN